MSLQPASQPNDISSPTSREDMAADTNAALSAPDASAPLQQGEENARTSAPGQRPVDDKRRYAFHQILSFLFQTNMVPKDDVDALIQQSKSIKDGDLLTVLKEAVGPEKINIAVSTISNTQSMNKRQGGIPQAQLLQSRPPPLSGAQGFTNYMPSQRNMFLRASANYMPSPSSTNRASNMTGARVMQQPMPSMSSQYWNVPPISSAQQQQTNSSSSQGFVKATRPRAQAKTPQMPNSSAVMGTPVSTPHAGARQPQQNLAATSSVHLQSQGGSEDGVRPMHFSSRPYSQAMQARVPLMSWGQIANPMYMGMYCNPYIPATPHQFSKEIGTVGKTSSIKVGEKRQAAQTFQNQQMPPTKRVSLTDTSPEPLKSGRNARSKRPVEDPNAPDVASGDVISGTDIQLNEEYKALFGQFKTKMREPAATEGTGPVQSDWVNVGAVKEMLEKELEKKGIGTEGSECLEATVRGLEERFEPFLKAVAAFSRHRQMPVDETKITSDIRSKLNEIKKKQAERVAAKEKAEREKLEKLLETATKKEIAANKELAAKIEKVRKEKEFSAEAAATNRALSIAFGGLGFDKFRKMKKEMEKTAEKPKETEIGQREAAEKRPQESKVAAEMLVPKIEDGLSPMAESPKAIVAAVDREQSQRVTIAVKDVMAAMSQDKEFSHSKKMYEMHLH